MRRWIALTLALAAGGYAAACAGTEITTSQSQNTIVRVLVTPPQDTVGEGDTVRFQASVQNAAGEPLPGMTVTWTSSNTAVATVSATGIVTGLTTGSAIIRATTQGASGQGTIVVTRAAVGSVELTPSSGGILVGQTLQLVATVRDATGNTLNDRTVTWASSNAGIASVTGTGLVRAVSVGQVTISATSEGKVALATVSVSAVPAASITVSPASLTLTAGQSAQLTATVRDANGNVLIGRAVTWVSANQAVAGVSGDGFVVATSAGSTTITASVEGRSATVPVTVNPVPVASVSVTPASASLTVGQTVQITATPRDAAGNALTGRVITYASSNGAVATVSTSGLVAAAAVGSATITATSEGRSGTMSVTVSAVPVATVTVTPASATVAVGQTAQFTATARDANGNIITGRAVTWTSNNTSVATVSATGLMTGVAAGNTAITATVDGVSGAANVAITNVPVASVTVAPASANLTTGQQQQFTATLRDAAGNVLTGRIVTWSSSNAGIAPVTGAGLVTAGTPGTATITASSEGQSGSATVTVSSVPVASVTVTPASSTLNISQTVQLTATARDASGNVLPGRTVVWTSSNTAVVSVSGSGLVTANALGSETVTATVDGVAGTASVSVVPVRVATVTVTPSTASLTPGQNVQLTATTRDANGNILPGRVVTWSTSNSAVASVSASGFVAAVSAGSATITATSEGVTGTAAINVSAPVATVTVTPNSASLTVGQTVQLTATARDAAGNVLPGKVFTWSSSAPGTASVSSSGLVSAAAVGSATITATSEGQSGTSVITVTQVPVSTVTVTVPTNQVVVGQTLQATATMRDASGNILPGRAVTWSSSNTSIATVSASGLITGVAQGSVTITATSEGRSGSVTITVVTGSSSGVPDLASLPVVNRQLPDFSTYPGRGLAAGQSYNDPISGVRIWKMTDATTPVSQSAAQHDYSGGPVQVSREWGTGQHTLLTFQAGSHYLVDFRRGVGFSNWRDFARTSSQLGFTFSQNPATPRIAFYTQGNVLRRVNTQTGADEPAGNFPHSFAAQTGTAILWLHQDKNDEWFVMMPADQARVIAWNSVTNQTLTRTLATLDEPHLEKDGRYVMMINDGASANMYTWDLQTNQATGNSGRLGVHVDGVRRYFHAQDPNPANSPQFYMDPTNNNVVETHSADEASAALQHRAGQWVQSDAELGGNLLRQWVLFSPYNDGEVSQGGWTLSSGQIYFTTVSFIYEQAIPGIQSVRQFVAGDASRVQRQLTRVTSQAALVEGSFYFDPATRRTYVWALGGGSPAGRVALRAPSRVHDAIAYLRIDGGDARYLAHHYSVDPGYDASPKGTISPDGRLVMFTSNMNDSNARNDVFVIEVPLR